MKHFIVFWQSLAIFFFLCKFDTVKSENRKWLEIDKELFIIEPRGNYTWQQAVAECKKDHSNLINPKGDYDYAKLKDAIKRHFNNFYPFWTNTQVKWTTIFHQIGLGKEEHNRQRCNKFDNSSTFKFLPENCNSQLGFICEKPLLKGYSSFNTKNDVYLVQPDQEYNCEQAYDQCEKRQMSLLALKDHANNQLLKNYIFNNYGSSVKFWFGYENETHYNCATHKRGQHIRDKTKLGFICQRTQVRSSGMTMRHLILLIFVALGAFIAISMFIIVKCFCSKRVESLHLSESYDSAEMKVTDIK